MIAVCGLNCAECDAFIATRDNDNALRAKLAQEWTELYNVPITAEEINCTGCLGDGVKISYCDQMCEIRKCALENKLDNCAACKDYACDKLGEIFKNAANAKDNLDNLRK